MRQKVMLLFFTIASGLVMTNIGLQFTRINLMQSSLTPRYVLTAESQESGVEKDKSKEADFQKWAEEFSNGQGRIGG